MALTTSVAASARSEAVDACGLPTARPLWIDYGEGSVPKEVRDVFARPGVVIAASGTAIPDQYRAKGAATVFFVLNLPRLVGEPGDPADPTTVPAMVDQTFERAVASTKCATPVIGLNELLGPAAPVPWTANVKQYRANVLALVRGLAAKGAKPALFIHGAPVFSGEAADWWREVGSVSDVIYESYYNAPSITKLGRIVGTRRIRMGMRSMVTRFLEVGIPRERIGFALGFQVRLGTAGREGLRPSSAWYRYVKWNALAAKQVAVDEGITSIWSWGWAVYGPESTDPDKPAAACVYLWARDQTLCDGPGVAGDGFDASLVEATITLPENTLCVAADGRIGANEVSALTRVTRSREVAYATLFARMALQHRVPVTAAEILAYERKVVDARFGGSFDAYRAALEARHATLAIARGVIADVLHQRRVEALVSAGVHGSPEPSTVLGWTASLTSAEADTATCLRDLMPGTGDFPASNDREIARGPLLMRLPFLGADDRAPLAPAALTAKGTNAGVSLDWSDGGEPDLIGYVVYRKDTPGAAFARLTPLWLTHSTFVDRTAPSGATPIYVVRAVDASGNQSAPTPETAPTSPAPPTG
jgi:hypothetical protein